MEELETVRRCIAELTKFLAGRANLLSVSFVLDALNHVENKLATDLAKKEAKAAKRKKND